MMKFHEIPNIWKVIQNSMVPVTTNQISGGSGITAKHCSTAMLCVASAMEHLWDYMLHIASSSVYQIMLLYCNYRCCFLQSCFCQYHCKVSSRCSTSMAALFLNNSCLINPKILQYILHHVPSTPNRKQLQTNHLILKKKILHTRNTFKSC